MPCVSSPLVSLPDCAVPVLPLGCWYGLSAPSKVARLFGTPMPPVNLNPGDGPPVCGSPAFRSFRRFALFRAGGGLLWYDVRYDSLSNRNVRAVTAARVRELFPPLRGELATVTLLPPLARRLGPLTAGAYPLLARVAPLRSHLIGLLRKPLH